MHIEQLDSILDNIETSVIVIDLNLNVTYSNFAATQIFGLSKSKLQNSQIFADQKLKTILHESMLAQKSISITEVPITVYITTHVVDLTLTPYLEGSIIELKPILEQSKIKEQSNVYAQQEAAQFLIQNLAHEIKNPLGAIKGATQLLAKELTYSQKEYTDVVIEQVNRLAKLVDNLLGPQKPEGFNYHNIHKVIDKVLKLLSYDCPKTVQIITDFDPSLPDIFMDPEQLTQALLNISQNAIFAIEDTGYVLVKTRARHQVILQNKSYKLALEIAIIDNGKGISPKVKDTLLYPMVTDKESGSGLGLSIANNIIKLHGGRIEYETKDGKTIFSLFIPITAK